MGVCHTCKASKWAWGHGTLKLSLRRITKKCNTKHFGEEECMVGGCWSDFILPVWGMHGLDMMVCHHPGPLAFLVPSLKHFVAQVPGLSNYYFKDRKLYLLISKSFEKALLHTQSWDGQAPRHHYTVIVSRIFSEYNIWCMIWMQPVKHGRSTQQSSWR